MSWPRVPVLPDPDEDIRILGVPVGRLFWLGPLLFLPLLLASLLMSLGAVAALPAAFVFFLAVYALFGLDLWWPIYWAAAWWLRPERRGRAVALAPGSQLPASPAADFRGSRPGMAGGLVSRLGRGLGQSRSTPYPSPAVLALVRPPPVEYIDPESLWRRWGDSLRRALRRGASVRVVTWVEPDWDVARWEQERRAVLGADDDGLRELAAQRWVLHRDLSVAAGRRVLQAVQVVRGPGTPGDATADLARHCGAALAGAGHWTAPDPAARAEVYYRALDWPGWFDTTGSGSPELVALWRGANEGNGEPVQDNDIPDAIVTTVDKSVDKTDEQAAEPDVGGGEVVVGPGRSVETAVGERTVEGAPPSLPSHPPDPGPTVTGPGRQAIEVEPGDARDHRSQFPGLAPLTAALESLNSALARRRLPFQGDEEALTDDHEWLERPARPLIAVWSPVPAGKTTVAAELAAALARGGVSVTLLDLDSQSRAMGGRLCVPSRTSALSGAMASRPIDPLPDPVQIWPGVGAFVDAPDAPPAGEWSIWRLNRLLAAGAPEAEWWVADLPATGALVPLVLDAAWVVVLVADPDWSRVGHVRRAYREWSRAGKPVLVVVNRWVKELPGVPHLQPSEVLGVEPVAVVPFDPAVYTAAVTGRPAAVSSPTVMAAMEELAVAVGRAVLTQATAQKGSDRSARG